MNTHLHILEAYTTLYKIWPNAQLKISLQKLLDIFLKYIIDKDTNHLKLFFDEKWQSKSSVVSFGHDIEASWLLLEAAEALGNGHIIDIIKEKSVDMAQAAAEGMGREGALYYEYNPESNHWVKEKHWWVQAEAMVGFFNAWQLTGKQSYYDKFLSVWNFTNQKIIDRTRGEWYWGLNEDDSIMQQEDKAGFWKCPYHNSRACMEIVKRMKAASMQVVSSGI